MSFPVIDRMFAHTMQRGSYLAALFFLADRADEYGVSWYGVKTIAAAVNLSPRQTRVVLSTLRERGEIWYTSRFHDDGSQTSNGYLVCCGLSLEAIGAALSHPQLQLSDEEIDTAVYEIAAARGELATDGAPLPDAPPLDDANRAALEPNGAVPAEAAPAEQSPYGGRARHNGRAQRHGDHAGRHGDHAGRHDVGLADPDSHRAPDPLRPWAGAAGAAARVGADTDGPDDGRKGRRGERQPLVDPTTSKIDAAALWERVLTDMQRSMPAQAFKAHLLGTWAEWVGDAPRLVRGPPGDVLSQTKGNAEGGSKGDAASDPADGRPNGPRGDPALLAVWARSVSVPWLIHRYQERAERCAAEHAGQRVSILFLDRTQD